VVLQATCLEVRWAGSAPPLSKVPRTCVRQTYSLAGFALGQGSAYRPVQGVQWSGARVLLKRSRDASEGRSSPWCNYLRVGDACLQTSRPCWRQLGPAVLRLLPAQRRASHRCSVRHKDRWGSPEDGSAQTPGSLSRMSRTASWIGHDSVLTRPALPAMMTVTRQQQTCWSLASQSVKIQGFHLGHQSAADAAPAADEIVVAGDVAAGVTDTADHTTRSA
jgi:hypothetical protein